nr:aldo/keto reductase [Frankia sp. AgB32]
MGHGALRLAGPGVLGPRRTVTARSPCCGPRPSTFGIRHLDTADFYGPHVTNELIREALAPAPPPSGAPRSTTTCAPSFPLGGFTPLRSDALGAVAGELGATPMAVALAWLPQRSPNILLIPGTSSVAHLRENVAAAGLPAGVLRGDAAARLRTGAAAPLRCAPLFAPVMRRRAFSIPDSTALRGRLLIAGM